MSKYETEAGIPCTDEECKLIDSLKRLAKKWKATKGNRLYLYSASGSMEVMMGAGSDSNPIPAESENGGRNPKNVVTTICGIPNDGGDW